MKNEAIERQNRNAIAAYTGPVTRCRPGKAKGKAKTNAPQSKADAAARWLRRHENEAQKIREANERAEQRARRRKKRRIAKRNAPLLKPIDKAERRYAIARELLAAEWAGRDDVGASSSTKVNELHRPLTHIKQEKVDGRQPK